MEFWGVEVKSGNPVKCDPGDDHYIHLSQVALGESKTVKGNEQVFIKVTVDNKDFVVGTLSYGKRDQIQLDLVFEKEFTLSHSGACSVYFCGYKTEVTVEDEDEIDPEELQKFLEQSSGKPVSGKSMQDNDGKDDESEEDESDEEDSDEDEESEEEQPSSKKRPAAQAKSLEPVKKNKISEEKTQTNTLSTPKQENGGKKNAVKDNGSQAKSPASGKKLSQYSCQPCNKSFISELALNQHNTAKHK